VQGRPAALRPASRPGAAPGAVITSTGLGRRILKRPFFYAGAREGVWCLWSPGGVHSSTSSSVIRAASTSTCVQRGVVMVIVCAVPGRAWRGRSDGQSSLRRSRPSGGGRGWRGRRGAEGGGPPPGPWRADMYSASRAQWPGLSPDPGPISWAQGPGLEDDMRPSGVLWSGRPLPTCSNSNFHCPYSPADVDR
jgi:hypothetical protein